MGKLLAPFLALLLLAPSPAAAEKPKYAAVIFTECSEELLEALDRREVTGNFFLRREDLPLARELANRGHGLGLLLPEDLHPEAMSRRQIAGYLSGSRQLLPPETPVRFLYSPVATDGVRQVAEVTGLALIEPGPWNLKRSIPGDGDILLLRGDVLAAVDVLLASGFRLVTLQELARVHQVRIRAGQSYSALPPSSSSSQERASARQS